MPRFIIIKTVYIKNYPKIKQQIVSIVIKKSLLIDKQAIIMLYVQNVNISLETKQALIKNIFVLYVKINLKA